MRDGNENKTSIVDRLINSMVKPPPEKKKLRAKSPVHKFSYQLPKSFFHAVDNARVEAGYDVLPHFHHMSISPSSKKHRENGQKHAHSSSSSDHDIASKKAQVRRTNPKHSHHHHHRQKKELNLHWQVHHQAHLKLPPPNDLMPNNVQKNIPVQMLLIAQ